jgi:putative endonuclease
VLIVTSSFRGVHYDPKGQVREFRVLARPTETAIRLLDRVSARTRKRDAGPAHQQTGRRGKEAAYFYLRKRGYVMVARNYRSSRRRGEVDLMGWDKDVLCFVEVKTRTSRDVKPPGAAVDGDKKRELAGMAREYLRRLPAPVQWRFGVVSVNYEGATALPIIELFKNAFAVS